MRGGDFESLKEFVTDVCDSPVFPVRNALILAYQYAIARYDVDGFRVDTVKHVELAGDKSNTIVFPLPMEVVNSLIKTGSNQG